jgi:hypothetical protein
MLALNSGSATTTSAADSSTIPSRQMLSKNNAAIRRRRSKGTIAGFAGGGNTNVVSTQTSTLSASGPALTSFHAGEESNNAVTSRAAEDQVTNDGGGSASGTIVVAGSIIHAQNTQSQAPPSHTTNDASGVSGKPCHAARLALLCCQNAIRMGARTQLGLCPPGRARRELKMAMRQQKHRLNRGGKNFSTLARRSSGQGVLQDVGGYYGVDKMVGLEVLDVYSAQEEDFLVNANTFDAESDEEASSGDDDDLSDLKDLLSEESSNLDDEKKYLSLTEPLFTPNGAESITNSGGRPLSGSGGGLGKLPFNRKKIRYFDSVTASDTIAARAYLNQEILRSKKREFLLLAMHLKRTQRRQRRQLKEQRGEPLNDADFSDSESDEISQRSLMPSSVATFTHPMTPAVAAALVTESLAMNRLESIEGMAKCYDGIVAAGVALLECNISDPMSPSTDSPSGGSHVTRPEIMAALTPLLITSLDQPSGDVISALARMRRMCGTPRYQRRFVQRVAPALIRPPRGAMWCLRHQNDMEPILAAAELIFDSASDVFSKGWYDRGQLLLADTKRAETLNTAAMQLKNLSSNPEENLTLDLGHTTWRSNKYKSGKDTSKGGAKEPLAEWEVIAVDRQIRVSISNIISMDWSRVVVHSKDTALSTASYHRSRQGSKRPTSFLQPTSSGDMSPKNITSTQLSPIRQAGKPINAFTSTYGDGSDVSSFFKELPSGETLRERTRSPIPTIAPSIPLSPPPPNRSGADDLESRLPVDQFAQATSNLFPPSEHTPPRSPTPKHKEYSIDPSTAMPAPGADSPASPKRGRSPVPGSFSATPKESIESVSSSPVTPQFGGDKNLAPMSPPSAGSAPPSDNVPHRRMSSASSVGSSITGMTGITGSGTQPSHYRMLTSTAAERKRTVAACRALRAQITRFEEAFVQLHGRPPKGAAERAPLATTYAQYREWKRAIRADAACRIQALFRGASTRWMLLRSNNPKIAKVVMSRAGRQILARPSDMIQTPGQDSVLKELSIPTEIGDNRQPENNFSGNGGGLSSDAFGFQGRGANQTLAPQWGNQIVRRRSGSGEGFASSSSIPKPAASIAGPVGIKASGDFSRMSLSDLQARKRDLKQQLKQYDMNFARKNGRMPVKAEKEPIRHLYEKYNALKSQITTMEQEGRQSASPIALQQSSAILSQRTVSPVGSDSEESGPQRSYNMPQRVSPSSNPPGAPTPTQDLSALKAEKGRLHQMLRSYEKDFFREHQRQVSSFADIRPVASQYRRYKDIKKAIAALQSGER